VVNFTPRPLYPRYPLERRLGGPQSRSGRSGEEKILDPTGIWDWVLSRKQFESPGPFQDAQSEVRVLWVHLDFVCTSRLLKVPTTVQSRSNFCTKDWLSSVSTNSLWDNTNQARTTSYNISCSLLFCDHTTIWRYIFRAIECIVRKTITKT
jgi:hypothetical protein